MKTKSFILFVICFLISRFIFAVSAYPGLVEFVQPDGTKLNIYLKGDEKNKWAQSEDGYTLLHNKNGFFEYAVQDANGDIVLSGVTAKNIGQRDMKEKSLLDKTGKSLFFSESQLSVLNQISQIKAQESAMAQAFPTTGTRKLICILIGYKDKPFVKTNADFDALFNTTGYTVDGATGSVKDFYAENSYNQLNLQVDVAGPFVASQNLAYYGANDANGYDLYPRELVAEAIDLANPTVNFANYDNDGNGTVDGVYVIYAGYGEEAGAPANTIWAHAWALASPKTCDGVTLQSYSCSSELRGTSGTSLCRIGVICHEFGHVLGSPDFYDTNYSTNGQYEGTGYWDLMASGSWNNNGATPAHFTGLVKVRFLNWATETVLSSAGSITMYNAELDKYSFYRVNTTTTNEYFFIENRQKQLFDAYIPGSGMIIYHVNSGMGTSGINITHPQKMYPVSQNATTEPNSTPSSYGSINSTTCPWTGTGKSEFSDTSTPSSRSWAGANTGKPLTQIYLNTTTKTVTFNVGAVATPPAAPVANAATSITQTGFSANWSASTGATGYYLDVATNSTFTTYVSGYQNKAVGSVLTSAVSSLTAGTTYYYRVRAYNANGTSTNSNTITATTLANPPAAPVALSATSVTQTGFTAKWNASSGATRYYLDVSTSSTFASFVTGYNNKNVSNVTSSAVTGLTANLTYYYRVRAYNTGGTSGNSNTITTTLLISKPAAPVASAATNLTSSGFTANWSKSAGATKYYLDVSTSSSFLTKLTNYNNLLLGDVSSWPVTGLTANKSYYYRVRAGNSAGTSSNSGTIKCTTTSTLKSAEIAVSSLPSPDNIRFSGYPNPFHTMVDLSYSIPEESKVSVEVFDIQGRMVKTLVNETQQPGDYQCIWDATGSNNARVNPGLYLCRFRAGDHSEMIKLICQ
jgi:M6 family metalloprotease-like protein